MTHYDNAPVGFNPIAKLEQAVALVGDKIRADEMYAATVYYTLLSFVWQYEECELRLTQPTAVGIMRHHTSRLPWINGGYNMSNELVQEVCQHFADQGWRMAMRPHPEAPAHMKQAEGRFLRVGQTPITVVDYEWPLLAVNDKYCRRCKHGSSVVSGTIHCTWQSMHVIPVWMQRALDSHAASVNYKLDHLDPYDGPNCNTFEAAVDLKQELAKYGVGTVLAEMARRNKQ